MKRCKHKGRYFAEGGETPKETPVGSYLSIGTTLLPGIVNLFDGGNDSDSQRIKSLGETYRDDVDQLANTQFAGSNASLAKQSTMLPVWENLDMEDFGGSTNEGASFLSGALSGASAAAVTANPWIIGGSALVGGLTGFFNASDSNRRKRREINSINQAGLTAENRMRNNFNAAIGTTDARNDRWRMQNMYNTNYAAFGGLLETNGANWETGATFINNGGTHQANPFGGVQFGVASDGLPNMVEEGEIIIKVKDNPNNQHSFAYGGSPTYSDYAISAREDMAPNLQEITDAKITDNPEYYVGWAPARIYEDITKKNHIHEVPNRQDTKDYIDSFNERFAGMQEATRTRKEQEQLMERLKKATPEEQDYIMQALGMQQPMQGEYLGEQYASGGSIHIAPSKKGTFTAAATKHGKSVQEFARQVLANKENYSPAMVKKANFARNSAKWHQWGGWTNQDELNNYYAQQYTDFWNNLEGRKGSNVNRAYLTGAQARQWVNQLSQGDEQQQALANMLKNQWGDNLDWSENANWEFKNKYNPKGTVTESNPYLEWAGDNTAMKDALWGIKHIPQLSVDNRYQQGNYTPSTPEIILPAGPQSINRYWTYDWDTEEITPITEAEFNNPDEGWFIDNTLAQYGPDSEDDINAYRDLYLTNRTSNTSITDITDTETPPQKVEGITNYDWILPAISGANVIADVLGVTNRPDYSNARRIERAVLPPNLIDYNPNGRYVRPLLTDRNYVATRLANQGTAAINVAQNLSGNNSATALYNIALNNYLNNQAIGQALAQTDEANNEAIRQAVTANNAVDRANAEGAFNADKANQSVLEDYARRYAAQRTAGAKLREDIDTQVATNRSANWNNFLENMQGYFDNQRNRNMANSAYQGTGYWIDNSGTVHYTTKSPSSKTKKEAERRAKEIKNKKGE